MSGGITGFAASRRLVDAGFCAGLRQSRGVGGRVASRRIEGAPFDHGAQFLTRRSVEFSKFVEDLLSEQIVSPWFGETGKERYSGLPSMNQIAKALAEGLDVTRGMRIERVRSAASWEVSSETEQVRGRSLLMTQLAPQALDLLEGEEDGISARFQDTITRIKYDKGIALMALLEVPFSVSDSGFLQYDYPEPIATVADTLKKLIGKPWRYHSVRPEFAERHFDSNPDTIIECLLDAYPRSKELKKYPLRCKVAIRQTSRTRHVRFVQ